MIIKHGDGTNWFVIFSPMIRFFVYVFFSRIFPPALSPRCQNRIELSPAFTASAAFLFGNIFFKFPCINWRLLWEDAQVEPYFLFFAKIFVFSTKSGFFIPIYLPYLIYFFLILCFSPQILPSWWKFITNAKMLNFTYSPAEQQDRGNSHPQRFRN